MREGASRVRRSVIRAARAVGAFFGRNIWSIAAGVAGVFGAAVLQVFGALASVPVAILGREIERHRAGRLRASCLATIGEAAVHLLDDWLVLDEEVLRKLVDDEPLTIRGLGELAASGQLRDLGWLPYNGYRLSERLRASWMGFETATARCAGVLGAVRESRQIDEIVAAVKEAASAAHQLQQAHANANEATRMPSVAKLATAQSDARQRFDDLSRSFERVLRAATELERLVDADAAEARAAAVRAARAEHRARRVAADRGAAEAAGRLDIGAALEDLNAQLLNFVRETGPGSELSEAVLDRVRTVIAAGDRLRGLMQRRAVAPASESQEFDRGIDAARELLRAAIADLDRTVEACAGTS